MATYVGIDIGKLELQVYENNKSYTIENTKNQIEKWLSKLTDLSDIIMIFEPTGGYEKQLLLTLSAREIDYAVVHANYVRAYAKSLGILAKSDKIDARIIAAYATAMKIMPCKDSSSKEHAMLRSLTKRRDQLLLERSAEKMRLDKVLDKAILQSIENHIKWLDNEIARLEDMIDQTISNNQKLAEDAALMGSIPSIGKHTVHTLLAYLPELKQCNKKQLAALVGVAPYNRDSGKSSGKRFIFGGRKLVRKALYLAAVASLKHFPDMRDYYMKMKAKGKPSKVALIAIVNKLIGMLSCVMKRGTPWIKNLEKTA